MLYDKDIREPLFEFLEEYYGKIRILEEKRMGKSRADVVMVTPDAIFGMEIKSDADTYARLESQVKDYNTYYDYNYVVVGSSHAAHIEQHVPEFWGIITVDEPEAQADDVTKKNTEADFYILRKPQPNPKRNWKKKISLLWRPELVHIQELNQMPKYKEKSKVFVSEKILEKVPEDVLNRQFSEELFQRDYEAIGALIQEYRRQNGRAPRRKKRISKRYKVKT